MGFDFHAKTEELFIGLWNYANFLDKVTILSAADIFLNDPSRLRYSDGIMIEEAFAINGTFPADHIQIFNSANNKTIVGGNIGVIGLTPERFARVADILAKDFYHEFAYVSSDKRTKGKKRCIADDRSRLRILVRNLLTKIRITAGGTLV
jgi:hypothetical protein